LSYQGFKNVLHQYYAALSGIRSKQSQLCFEDIFKKRATVESRNFIPLEPDLNFSSSVNLFEDPSAFFSADRNTVPVIFDTGSRVAITNSKDDFVKPPQPLHRPLFLGGMADGLEVMGIGEICWTFVANDNTAVQIVTDGYYVPQGNARLLIPQCIFNKQQGISGHYRGDEDKFSLRIDGLPPIEVPYNCSSGLHIAKGIPGLSGPSANLSLLTIDNSNLSMGRKTVLELHYHFGHLGLQQVQFILHHFLFASQKFSAAAKCITPLCQNL